MKVTATPSATPASISTTSLFPLPIWNDALPVTVVSSKKISSVLPSPSARKRLRPIVLLNPVPSASNATESWSPLPWVMNTLPPKLVLPSSPAVTSSSSPLPWAMNRLPPMAALPAEMPTPAKSSAPLPWVMDRLPPMLTLLMVVAHNGCVVGAVALGYEQVAADGGAGESALHR